MVRNVKYIFRAGASLALFFCCPISALLFRVPPDLWRAPSVAATVQLAKIILALDPIAPVPFCSVGFGMHVVFDLRTDL